MGQQASILCVDDERNPLLLRTLVLKKAGFDVVPAMSAAEALEALDARSFDLVLTDVLMPGTSGTELAQEIKKRNPDLPVILFSGINELPADGACADLFVSKLEGPSVLCQKISEIIASKSTTASRPA